MADLVATRTLVKSPPELWEELSDIDGLTRHLGQFGEIRISRLEPEKEIAWEAERASGTVEIEASSWGTKVVLTADVPDTEAEPEQPDPEPEPPAVEVQPRPSFFARWLFRERRAPQQELPHVHRDQGPAPESKPATEPEPARPEVERALALLEEALDSLGAAHHRPFSRG